MQRLLDAHRAALLLQLLGTPEDDLVKIGVLTGSVLSALLATVVLRIRNRHYRRLGAEE